MNSFLCDNESSLYSPFENRVRNIKLHTIIESMPIFEEHAIGAGGEYLLQVCLCEERIEERDPARRRSAPWLDSIPRGRYLPR